MDADKTLQFHTNKLHELAWLLANDWVNQTPITSQEARAEKQSKDADNCIQVLVDCFPQDSPHNNSGSGQDSDSG